MKDPDTNDLIAARTKAEYASAPNDTMRAISASEIACYKWPENTPEHRQLRAAFVAGAASGARPLSKDELVFVQNIRYRVTLEVISGSDIVKLLTIIDRFTAPPA